MQLLPSYARHAAKQKNAFGLRSKRFASLLASLAGLHALLCFIAFGALLFFCYLFSI
jgi:hypothetical protein